MPDDRPTHPRLARRGPAAAYGVVLPPADDGPDDTPAAAVPPPERRPRTALADLYRAIPQTPPTPPGDAE